MKYQVIILAIMAAVAAAGDSHDPNESSDSFEDLKVYKVDMKCRQNSNRMFKYDKNSKGHETKDLKACLKECKKDEKCKFVSFAATGTYATNCIACDSDAASAIDVHAGFQMYKKEDFDSNSKDSSDDKPKTVPQGPPQKCQASIVNSKCPLNHKDRLFREEGFSVEQCQEKCQMTNGCKFYSYAFEGAKNGFERVCMGCTSDKAQESHNGFHLFKEDCVGVVPASSVSGKSGGRCASGIGDPHFTTFDGLKYDCQGEGDYILSKSLNSGFQLQGRFEKVPGMGVTTHQGAVITTGVPGEPKVEVEYTKKCELSYSINNVKVDLEHGAAIGSDKVDFISSGTTRTFVFDSGYSMKVMLRSWRGDCLLNVYLCIPEAAAKERIVGILGSPDGTTANDFMDRGGVDLKTAGKTTKKQAHDYCVSTWCIPQAKDNLFATPGSTNAGCSVPFDVEFETKVMNVDPKIKEACGDNQACIVDTIAANGNIEEGLRTLEDEEADPLPPKPNEVVTPVDPEMPNEDPMRLAPPKESDPVAELEELNAKTFGGDSEPKKPAVGSGSGDPHFKTWTGEKYDYHGECDLVLVDHPTFNNGQGLKVHIRTTRVKYFSYIERAAIQIGDEVLEFANDAENFYINGKHVGENKVHHKTTLGGFVVRRDKKALSIRLHDEGLVSRQDGTLAKIDLHTRKNGFPAVIIDAGHTDIFKGSLGLLGDWSTGRKLARDGETEIEIEDPLDGSAFALEWQVRDTEPMLFVDARMPQWPQVCIPPAKVFKGRLGMEMARKEAEEACAHWKMDMEDCIFDVMATRDVMVAEEGHVVHIQ